MIAEIKHSFLTLLLLLPFFAAADVNDFGKNNGLNIMYVEDLSSQPENVIQLEIIVDNADPFIAFSFDLVFPEHIMTYNPDPGLTFLSDRATDHSLFITLQSPGLLRVFVFSFTNSPFSGNSGSIISVGFELNAPHETAAYPINLIDPILVGGAEHNFEDILDESFDGTLNIVTGEAEIPEILVIDNIQVGEGEVECFNATQSIITAGEDAFFTVQPGADATLIAGENIKMLSGTHIHSGATLHAYIAPNGPFCGEADKHFLAVEDSKSIDSKHTEITHTIKMETPKDPSFAVYPNPATDRFTLELFRFEPGDNPIAEIYNMQGRLIVRRELQMGQEHQFNLDEEQAGIYHIRVIQHDFIGVQRLIKR